MADIRATAGLDVSGVRRGFGDILDDALRFRRSLERILNFDPLATIREGLTSLGVQGAGGPAVLPEIPPLVPPDDDAIIPPGSAEKVRELREASLQLRREVDLGRISEQAAREEIGRLNAEIEEGIVNTQRYSREQNSLLESAGRLETATRRLNGEQSRFTRTQTQLAASSQSLNTGLQNLQNVLFLLASGAGFAGLIRFTSNAARSAAEARAQYGIFLDLLAGSGQSVEEGRATLAALAETFRTNEANITPALVTFTRLGATLEQSQFILERAGASALAFGRDAASGFEAAAQALAGETSQALNRIGIAGNISTAFREQAAAVGKSVDELTEQEKVQAFINLLAAETGEEFSALNRIFAGYIGQLSIATSQTQEFGLTLGRGLGVVLAQVLRVFNLLLGAILALPTPLQTLLGITAGLVTVVGLLGAAYGVLNSNLVRQQVIGNIILGILRSETILRTNLGRVLLGLAVRFQLLTREQLTNALAARRSAVAARGTATAYAILNGAARTAIGGVRALTRSLAAFAATPWGRLILAAVAALTVFERAVRRFPQVFKPATDAARAIFGELREAVVDSLPPEFFQNIDALRILVGFVLVDAARLAGQAILLFASTLQFAAAAGRLLVDVFRKGPSEAFREFGEEAQKISDTFFDGIVAIDTAAEAAKNLVENGTDPAKGGVEELTDEMKALIAEAEKLEQQFRDTFESKAISLIEDDEAREIEQTRQEFRKLRDEISEAAAENEVFAQSAPGLLAETFALEAQELAQIQENFRKEREEKETEALERLQEVIEDRETAIARARVEGLDEGLDKIFATYELQRAETIRLYDDLIAEAEENGQDTIRLYELRNEELLGIDRAYRNEVIDVYEGLYGELEDRREEFIRSQIESQNDPRLLAAFDFGAQLREINEFFDERIEAAAGSARLIAQAEEDRNAELVAAREQYWETILELTRTRGEEIGDLERELELRRLEFQRDPERDESAIVRARFEQERIDTLRAFAELEDLYRGNADDLARVERVKAATLLQINEELTRALADVAEEDQAEAFEPAIESLLSGLDRADFTTIESIENQLTSWRVAYGANGEIVELLDDALGKVESRYESLTESVSNDIDQIIEKGEQLADRALSEAGGQNLDKVGQIYADAAEDVAGLQEAIDEIASQLVNATDEQRVALLSTAERLLSAQNAIIENAEIAATRVADETREKAEAEFRKLEDSVREATAKAVEEARKASEEFDNEVADIRERLSEAAVQSISGQVETALAGIEALNLEALQAARTELTALLAQLTVAGVQPEALAELQEQRNDLTELIQSFAGRTADFAAEQLSQLREVANAVLDEGEAREISLLTLEREVDFRRDAITELNTYGGSAEEAAERNADLVRSQLAVVSALEDEIDRLEGRRDAVRDSFSELERLAELTNNIVPPRAIRAQRELAITLAQQVRSLQAGGIGFTEYRGELDAATESLDAFLTVQRSELDAAVADTIGQSIEQAKRANEEATRANRERTDEVKAEIEQLERRNKLLEESLGLVGESREFRDLVEQFSRVELTDRERLDRLRDQRAAQLELFETAVALGRPLEEQIPILRTLVELNEEIGELGGKQLEFRQSFIDLANQSVTAADASAAASLRELAANEDRIEGLNSVLRGLEATAKDLEDVDATAFADPAALDAIARQASEIFGIPFEEAADRLKIALEEGTTEPFENLEQQIPPIFNEIFRALGLEAAGAPGIFAQLDAEIAALEDDLQAVKDTIAAGLDLEAVAAGAASGFRTVIAALDTEADLGFSNLGRQAATDFTSAFNSQVEQARQATLETIRGIENELRETLEETFREPAEEAGFDAGRGLATAFAEGLEDPNNQARLFSVLESLLQRIRDMLPSSDAKRGPLRDITRSGSTFFPTWLRGVNRTVPGLERAMTGFTSRLLPSVRSLPGLAGAGSGPVTMNIDGRPTAPAGSTALQARALVRATQRELRLARIKGR